eukprot:1220427-Prymnesium_polylepis.1
MAWPWGGGSNTGTPGARVKQTAYSFVDVGVHPLTRSHRGCASLRDIGTQRLLNRLFTFHSSQPSPRRAAESRGSLAPPRTVSLRRSAKKSDAVEIAGQMPLKPQVSRGA